MILRANLPKLREVGGQSARVLDAGGWYRPFNLATHVIDLNPYESRRGDDALDPEDDERFKRQESSRAQLIDDQGEGTHDYAKPLKCCLDCKVEMLEDLIACRG